MSEQQLEGEIFGIAGQFELRLAAALGADDREEALAALLAEVSSCAKSFIRWQDRLIDALPRKARDAFTREFELPSLIRVDLVEKKDPYKLSKECIQSLERRSRKVELGSGLVRSPRLTSKLKRQAEFVNLCDEVHLMQHSEWYSPPTGSAEHEVLRAIRDMEPLPESFPWAPLAKDRWKAWRPLLGRVALSKYGEKFALLRSSIGVGVGNKFSKVKLDNQKRLRSLESKLREQEAAIRQCRRLESELVRKEAALLEKEAVRLEAKISKQRLKLERLKPSDSHFQHGFKYAFDPLVAQIGKDPKNHAKTRNMEIVHC